MTPAAHAGGGEVFQAIGDAVAEAAGDFITTWPPGLLAKITKAVHAALPPSGTPPLTGCVGDTQPALYCHAHHQLFAICQMGQHALDLSPTPPLRATADGVCCSCKYAGAEETPCEARDDKTHCEHWWDGPATAEGSGP